MNSRLQYIVAVVLIFAASLSRLLPHPMNFTPVAAIALFGGVYFNKKFAFIIPLGALLISDYFLGFYSEIVFVYAGFLIAGMLGLWLKNHKSAGTIAGTTLASSIIFFLITNYGAWLTMSDVYPRSLEGLITCYAAAIPFFRNSLAGDAVYVAALFGAYELSMRYVFKPVEAKA